jgi:hypothetical protein
LVWMISSAADNRSAASVRSDARSRGGYFRAQNDVLNAGGGKMAAEKLETALTSYAGVREAAAFMTTNKHGIEEVWAAIVCKGKVDAEGLRAHCRHLMPSVFAHPHHHGRAASDQRHRQDRPASTQEHADEHRRILTVGGYQGDLQRPGTAGGSNGIAYWSGSDVRYPPAASPSCERQVRSTSIDCLLAVL